MRVTSMNSSINSSDRWSAQFLSFRVAFIIYSSMNDSPSRVCLAELTNELFHILGRGEAFKSLPYRDSVLTWLLRDALSGKNHTTMLVSRSRYAIVRAYLDVTVTTNH